MPARPFDPKSNPSPPLLKRGGQNTVLLFPGSFNPPHKGHLELLKYIFEKAPASLNVIAAMIVLTDETTLSDKMSEAECPMVLTRKQRISLWLTNGFPKEWAWIFNRTQAEWNTFRTSLGRSVQRDGFNLKFILVGGPDNIGHGTIMDPSFWNVRDFITSDISRSVTFRAENSLGQLSGHTVWKIVDTDRVAIERGVRSWMQYEMHLGMSAPQQYGSGLSTDSSAEIDKKVTDHLSQSVQSWVCHRHFKPKGAVYFIPSSHTTRPISPPSSTNIRATICDTADDEALTKELGKFALNPELLVKYVRQMGPIKRQPKAVKKEPTAEEIAKAKQDAWDNISW